MRLFLFVCGIACLASHVVFHQTGYVLADDVEFYVYDASRLDVLEVGVLVCVGYDGNLKRAFAGIDNRKAYTVYCDRTFLDGCVVAGGGVVEGVVETAVGILYGNAFGRLVNMPLYNVAVKQCVGTHAAFYVYPVAGFQQTKVRLDEGLVNGCYGVCVAIDGFNRQAYAVVGDALVYLKLSGNVAAHGEGLVLSFLRNGNNGRHPFHYS